MRSDDMREPQTLLRVLCAGGLGAAALLASGPAPAADDKQNAQDKPMEGKKLDLDPGVDIKASPLVSSS